MSRTGTTALSQALNNLGAKTTHFSLEAFVQSEYFNSSLTFEPKLNYSSYRKWRLPKEIKAKNQIKVNDIFQNFEGFADLPFPLLFRELDELFPKSKFIYTYWDERKWLKSMKWLYSDGAVIWKHGLLDDEIKFWAYGTTVYDEEKLLTAYRNHHTAVLEYFESNPNFLYLNLDKNEFQYSLLCDFLEIPIINKPIERINEKQYPNKLDQTLYWLAKKYDLIDFIFLLKRMLYNKKISKN